MKHHRLLSAAIGLAAALFITGMAAARPLSHERIVAGDYAFVLGWLDEPPVVGLKNAALVEITTAQDDQPVEGAEGTLTAQIVYGGKTKELLLRPLEEQPGTVCGRFHSDAARHVHVETRRHDQRPADRREQRDRGSGQPGQFDFP